MVEATSDAAVEGRLRDFLTAELRRAEDDYPHLASRRAQSDPRRRPKTWMALAACAAIAVVAVGITVVRVPSFPAGQPPASPSADPLGPDGIPLSLAGEPVVRVSAIDDQMVATRGMESFLVGGYLDLHSRDCTAARPRPAPNDTPIGGCSEDWRLDDALRPDAGRSVRLTTSPGGATFTRTSGAPTVIRVRLTRKAVGGANGGYGGSVGPGSPVALLIESVVWRQPTKGRIPEDAVPPEGGDIQMALVPDFVGVWGGPTGDTIVGYAPKDLLLNPPNTVGGTLANPPQPLPIPVYGEDLTTLVGYSVAGKGFVPLGVDPSTVPDFPVVQGPSAGPSVTPSPSAPKP